MSSLEQPLPRELEILKAAFGRAVDLVGSGARMAVALGVSPSQVTRWKSPTYGDALPAHVYPKVDAISGYPCMLEAMALLGEYSIRRNELERADMPLCLAAGIMAEDSGRAARIAIEADADQVITLREFNCIEAEGRTTIANVNRMIDAARAKHEATAGQAATVLRMTGGPVR